MNARLRAKQRAEQVQQVWGDEHATARRYGVSVGFLRKDRARARPTFPFSKLIGGGRGGGFVRYNWLVLDEIYARSTHGQEESTPA
jgi:hypothetical protein